MLKFSFEKMVMNLKNYILKAKKETLAVLKEKILEDIKNYDKIAIICLGPSFNAPSPFLTFSSTIGTILKANHFWVYGDLENPIRIEKKKISPIQTEIDTNNPNTFTLVIVNSISHSKKLLGNVCYKNGSFQQKNILVGNATLTLFGSYGKNTEEYLKQGLSLEETKEFATNIAFLLMEIINQKHDLEIQKLKKKKNSLKNSSCLFDY